MYENLKALILELLKVEGTEPHPPSGYHRHEMMRVERAAPSYLRFRLFLWKLYLVAWSFGLIAPSVVLLMTEPWLLVFIAPLLVAAAFKAATLYVVSRLDYEMRWYVITERSLLIREGVWNVREITLTFANAQNVRITQGPVERYFGFSNVKVDTAGGGSSSSKEQGSSTHTAVLRGLANPVEVRDLILELLRRHQSAGLGDPDDRVGGRGTPVNPALVAEIWEEAKGMRRALERRKDM